MRKFLILILHIVLINISLFSQCEPQNAQNNEVNRAVAMVYYNGFNFAGVLVNNTNEDGRLLFLTTSYPFRFNCPGGSSVPLSGNNITFTWLGGNTTHGASIVSSSTGESIILELDEAPYETYSLLGVNTTSSPSFCISNYGGDLKKMDVDISTYGEVRTNCGNNTVNYDFSNADLAHIIRKWGGNKNMYSEDYSKGSPLLSSHNLVTGIYVTKLIDTLCGYDSAYFAKDLESFTPSLAGRGITFTPCIDVKTVSSPINTNKTIEASIRIIGSSIITAIVIFKAGKEVILEDGFNSGNDFIAEIEPCYAEKEVISSKNNGIQHQNNYSIEKKVEKHIVAYPTVLVDNSITIETEDIDSYNYVLYDTNGKLIMQNKTIGNTTFKLKHINKGVYFLKIYSNNFNKTFKLIKE